MLMGILYLLTAFNSVNFDVFIFSNLSFLSQIFLWFSFFLPFAIKTPVMPFHLWLPEAHVEAPTNGSVILAGLLLKLGSYGFIRFTLPLFPLANIYFSPIIYIFSILSVIYGSIITIRQIDLKKIIAYSSVAHMNLVVLGLFSLNLQGVNGSLYLVVAHGIVSSGLFFLIGIIYDKTHTRLVNYYGGLILLVPLWVFFLFNLSIANMAFPGTCNFIGELLIILGVWEKNTLISFLLTTSVVLSAVYVVWLFNRVCFGSFKLNYFSKQLFFKLKLKLSENLVLITLMCFTWVFGLTSELLLTRSLTELCLYVISF